MVMLEPAGDELLTPGEVAALLYVDPKTVTRWAVAGKLASIRTPGGHRRYKGSDVLAIMAGLHPDQASPRSSFAPPHGEDPSPHDDEHRVAAAAVVAEAVAVALESVAAEAARDVLARAAAVSQAARRAEEAAETARGAREFAAAAAAKSVARDAERTARRVHIRAGVAAMQVRQAAELAADDLLRSVHDGAIPDPAGAAAVVASTAKVAAQETALHTRRAAEAVSKAVTTTAAHVAHLVSVAEDSFAADAATTARLVEDEARAIAVQAARDTDARATGVAIAAREAAAALFMAVPSPRIPS